ncbi:uncharacterized protein ACLA_032110 [Aspergillus clavatus NRRL 1]|uniref:AT hook motif protein n=1 Tax=Aspergillus clavatus (strain ATCC 1007 / CBS 513.65 / DSM 816 / NCTC 3887 / NRRL 1 / QM 1276 / 107) TaxID=344612 RepID=A1CS55_ASPCL|nr:AT hook motif protein [Aspergillus clavatus NRRL 1]EAW08476.1 AT hook motif protein [Aspergillus clavatus NRRL 1]
MPMTWSPEADAKLLIGILNTSNVKLDLDALAKWMGPECTVYAIQHRIRKLQEKANSGSPGGDSAPASPEKRKRGRPRKNAYEGAAGEETGSPKKVKQGPAKKAVENEGEHGVSGGSGIEDA